MKNKKLSILFQSMRKIDQQLGKSQIAQQDTVKISFQSKSSQTGVIATAFQIQKLQKIFPHVKLHEMISDIEQYITLPAQILGKKSSRIILSKSYKYCLKSVEEDDINQIKNIFQSLIQRFKNNKSNCLIKIYFIFIVEYQISGIKLVDRFIIMPNIRANYDNCIKGFDIKGHLQSRAIDNQDSIDFKFGKDENFVHSDQLKFIKKGLGNQKIRILLSQIQQNVEFLNKNRFIDYSLLFSLEKQQKIESKGNQDPFCPQMSIDESTVLKWAIIDYFQIFNEKKKLQNRFKSIFMKSVSSVESEVYSKRLLNFLNKYLIG